MDRPHPQADALLDLERPAQTYRTSGGVYDVLGASGGEAHHVAHYQRDAAEFDYFAKPDPATAHENRRLHEALLRHVPASAQTVLDVGCGSAWVARALLPQGRTVVSLDAALVNTTEALRRYPSERHVAVTADALELPLREASVDAVVASEVMEHVPDVPRFLTGLIRVVRPGGAVVLSTPYDERIRYSLCVHCNRPTPMYAHLHSFTERSLAPALDALGGIDYAFETLSNKALLLLRTHRLLGPLPHPVWRRVDRLASRVAGKPARLLTVIRKR